MRYRVAALLVLTVLALALPYTVSPYGIHVVDVAIVFALLAIGLGIALGVSGQINLAQIAFFGIGAYSVGILTTQAGWGFWFSSLLALVMSVLFGIVVGIPALRVQSHYLGIVTLGLAVAFTNWTTNAAVTNGAAGMPGIPVPPMFGIDLTSEFLYYYLEIVVFAFGLAFALFLVHTPTGRRMRAMRDDSVAAGAMGANVAVLRLTAFVLASVYGGVAGILYAGLIRYIAPETFSVATMFLLLAMVIIGGRQSIVGCVVGALVLSLVREVLVDFSTYAQLGYGLVVVLMVVFAPTGLAGVPQRIRDRIVRHRVAERAMLGEFSAGDRLGARTGAGLEIDGLSKHFRGLKALDGVSLQIRPGEIRGVVGPNGSGKTTLFNVVSGLYSITSGTMRLDGVDVSGSKPHQLSHLGMARTFQNLRLFGQLSVRENLLVAADRTTSRSTWQYVLWPVGVWRHERRLRRHVDALLDQFGIADFADALPPQLPYGTQRRVEIARAVASGPRLLLLDEPAAGLNGQEVAQLSAIVRAIRDSGVTVVLVEHNMGLVMSLCDQVTVLASGTLIADGAPAEVAADPQVIEAYLGDSMSDSDLAPTRAEAEEATL